MVESLRDGSAWFQVSWEERPYRFGRVEFRVRGHGIGHLRGRQIADLPFPIRAGRVPVAEDKAEPHHLLPPTTPSTATTPTDQSMRSPSWSSSA